MHKVLIVSYFFPPSDITGGFRVYSWAKHLNTFGIFPVVVTRQWATNSSLTIEHNKYDNYEVYACPYHENLRDRIYSNSSLNRIRFLGKVLTGLEMVLQNFFIDVMPYKNLYYESLKILKKDSSIKSIVVSAKPFSLFKIGHMLHNNTGVPWIADYRDDWSTSQWYNLADEKDLYANNMILRKLEKRSEKKWLSNVACITTVSDFYAKRLSSFLSKPSYTVMNGFEEEDFVPYEEVKLFEEFTITYNGTLYHSQKIEPFLEAIKEVIEHYGERVKIKLLFPGLDVNPNHGDRVRAVFRGYESNFTISERITKKEVVQIQQKSHMLLMIAHQGIKGVASSKIFDYLGARKPIVLFEGDNDVLEEIVLSANAGYVWKTREEVKLGLIKTVDEYLVNSSVGMSIIESERLKYTRESQVEKLAEVIKKVNQI
ncbi:MAG: hypothetical protein HRT72_13415 [Flavobacteriales bacterium]|nr:hypothetical protein [Flavobacteriales bacterium]